jgi:hypothetical protein
VWFKPDNLDRHCWAAASVMQISGDVKSVTIAPVNLPMANDLYSSPENVQATRDGNEVRVTWDKVDMTDDDRRGYLIEATICQNGGRVSIAVFTEETSYEFNDDTNCDKESNGKLYTVEKHGYTDPVSIPWP